MKQSHIITGIVALTMLAATAGVTSTVLAADSTSTNSFFGRFKGKAPVAELTDAQKAEMKTKMDAVQAALDANSYDAWVTAVKAMDTNSPLLKKITADNFSEYVTSYKQREVERDARQAKLDEVEAAVSAGDYDAWVKAVKALDDNSPILEKITSSNFNRYVEAYKLRQQADSIMQELGVDQHGGRGGFEHGMMGGFGQGRHGIKGGQLAPDTGSTNQ